MKLLLVEDEEKLSEFLAKGLRKCGYAVDTAYDGEDALGQYYVNEYDLIVLDLNLPVLDGLQVLEKIREQDKHIRILILSARIAVEDRIRGLEMGANDYLIKPFDFGELQARIHVLLRMQFIQNPSVLQYAGIKLDTASKTVQIDGIPIELTRKEFGILEYLMTYIGQVISAERLIEHVWSSDADPFSNSFKFHIHSLKKKLGCNVIKNIRGCGYVVEDTNEDQS